MKFDCPAPTVLPEIPEAECPFNIGQIVRFAAQFRQVGSAPFTEATIKLKATWTALAAAVGATKVVFSPLFAGLTIPSSEEKVEGGGDNSTIFGIEDYVGENPVKVPFLFTNTHPEVVEALRKLIQASIPTIGGYRLTLYLFNEFGQILCVEIGAPEGGDLAGLPVYNFRIASRGSEGFGSKDKIPAGFSMPSDWDARLKIITPEDFNPLTDF